MPRVSFTKNLERHLDVKATDVTAATVREALDAVFETEPRLRGYLLDDQGRLRKHVVVFVDGEMVRDRVGLTDTIAATSEVVVMQALSGGAA